MDHQQNGQRQKETQQNGPCQKDVLPSLIEGLFIETIVVLNAMNGSFGNQTCVDLIDKLYNNYRYS